MTNLIADYEITVVIQGPLYLERNTKGADVLSCIASIRTCLPGARIVVSTWENERRYHEQIVPLVSQIVYSSTPASLASYDRENNITRQIISTKAGLACVDTPYALKIRANILVHEKTDFFQNPGDRLNLLALVGDPVTRFMLFVFPDFVQFGKTQIIKQLWDFEIAPEDYYLEKTPPSFFDIYSFPHSFKFSPEQYIGIAWAKSRHEALPLIRHQFDVNYSDFLFWKDILSKDFSFFEPRKAGFVFHPKRYTEGKFLDAEGAWLARPPRKQFLNLLVHKYVLFIFNTEWWKHIAKYVLFSISERAYWSLYKMRR